MKNITSNRMLENYLNKYAEKYGEFMINFTYCRIIGSYINRKGKKRLLTAILLSLYFENLSFMNDVTQLI